jgi:hypothetical protein
MNLPRYAILVLLVPLACSRNEDWSDPEPTADTESALLAHGKALWPMTNGTATIRVCWRPLELGVQRFPVAEFAPDLDRVVAERRRWIQENVEAEWNAKTVVKFVGWKDCGTEEADVPIVPMSSEVTECVGATKGQSCVDAFGTRVTIAGINILFGDEVLYAARYKRSSGPNFDPKNSPQTIIAPALCLSEARNLIQDPTPENEAAFTAEWKRCLQQTALHEFGHMLGFAHEWYRTDDEASRKACMADQGVTDLPPSPGGPGDTPLGPFDSESIMSYCRHEKAPILSPNDVDQTNAVYRELAPKVDARETDAGPTEDDEHEGASTSPSKKRRSSSPRVVTIGGCG